ncbi:MAG: hypothetical protein ABI560_12060, partial [Myxococcales bacterium]
MNLAAEEARALAEERLAERPRFVPQLLLSRRQHRHYTVELDRIAKAGGAIRKGLPEHRQIVLFAQQFAQTLKLGEPGRHPDGPGVGQQVELMAVRLHCLSPLVEGPAGLLPVVSRRCRFFRLLPGRRGSAHQVRMQYAEL